MVKVPKVVSLLSCAFILGLGLSHSAVALENALATDDPAQPNYERTDSPPRLYPRDPDTRKGMKMHGEVLRLEGNYYLVRRSDGKQVSLRMDDATQVTRTFAPGEWIEAQVEQELDGHHALSISPARR